MNPCPKCGENSPCLNQYGFLNGINKFQVHCHRCKFHSPKVDSEKLAEEAWNMDPMGKFQQLSLLA